MRKRERERERKIERTRKRGEEMKTSYQINSITFIQILDYDL